MAYQLYLEDLALEEEVLVVLMILVVEFIQHELEAVEEQVILEELVVFYLACMAWPHRAMEERE